jgi:DNA-binding XRE family transcriptional regulator
MKYRVHSAIDLGLLVRAVRKYANVRQDDLAATMGVSKQFASDVENGKPTAQIGLVLKVLRETGVVLSASIPDQADHVFHKLKARRDARGASTQKKR